VLILGLGFTQAALCKRLHASDTLANLPSTVYLAMPWCPIIVAWLYPQARFLKRGMSLGYAAMAVGNHDYDFGQVVRQAIERRSPNIQDRGCRLVFDVPRSGMKGWGDSERLARAVDHLLDNAVKFMPTGGTVGVRVRRLATGHFELCVLDTGPGVAAATMDHLFEPFVQGDGSPTRLHGGTGVGLAIVRGIAQGHGGDVRCASPADETVADVRFHGAGFYLVVPERASSSPVP